MHFDLIQKNFSFRALEILLGKKWIFSIDRRVLDSAQRTARRHSMISALKNKGNYKGSIDVCDKCWQLVLVTSMRFSLPKF